MQGFEARCAVLSMVGRHACSRRLRVRAPTPRCAMLRCAGAQGPKADVLTCAALTVRTLQRTVPAAVPGIMFLSGGWEGHTLA